MERALGPEQNIESKHHDRPRLSVIVPAYNVQGYLVGCLDSVAGQSFEPFEIIVIDDGSTDGTASVANEFARTHRSVRVISTTNHGLGAARNRGVAESTGELIAFADSDDTVLPGAYRHLTAALTESGSDFVVGSMRRSDGLSSREPRWMRRLHREHRIGVSIEDHPEMLGDVFAWNKIFRREFWDREQLTFPEGIRYEDQVAVTHAYLTADTFDVVRPVVYDWRIRTDGSAITDARHDLEDLVDRVATKRTSLETVSKLASVATYDVFREWVLPGDMWRYFAHIPGCTDEYWGLLHDSVCEFWPGGDFSASPLTVPNRLVGWLVGQGRRGQAAAVVRFVEKCHGDPASIIAGGDVIAELPFWNDPESQVPLHLYRLRDKDLGWGADVRSVRIDDDTLLIEGAAGFRHVGAADSTARVVLTSGSGRQNVSRRLSAAGFTATFDLRRLLADEQEAARTGPLSWRASVRLESQAFSYDGSFTSASPHARAGVAVGDQTVESEYRRGQLTVTAYTDGD